MVGHVLPSLQQTYQTGSPRDRWPNVFATAPWLESWDETDIEAYENVLDSAERHLAGRCDSRGFIVDGVLLPECRFLMPARESGKFEEGRCPRRVQAEFQLALKQSGLPRRHLRGLDELETNEVVQQVKEWVRAFEPGCRGLLLAGKVGTGKTQLVTAAGYELLKLDKARPAVGGAPPVFYTTAHALLAALKDFDGTAKEVRQKAHGAGVLILDDLGAEGATDWSRSEVVSRQVCKRRFPSRRGSFASSGVENQGCLSL